MEAWLIGVVLAALAAIFASLGDNLVKLSFTQIAQMQSKGVEPPPVYKRPVLLAGNFCLTVLNTGLTITANVFADASLTIPLGGLHIAMNMPLAYWINKESSSRRAVGINLVVFLAVLIVLVSGNRDPAFFTAPELWAMCFRGAFMAASLAMVGICAMCKIFIDSPNERLRKLGHTVGAGVVGSFTQPTAKAMSLCLNDGAWDHPILYFSVLCTIGLALMQVFVLNRCLDMYTASFVVPIVNATIIVLGSIYSAVYFREMERWDLQSSIFMPFGIFLCAAAIAALANEPDAKVEGHGPAMSEMSASIRSESARVEDASAAATADDDEGLADLLIRDVNGEGVDVGDASDPGAAFPPVGSPEVYLRLEEM